MGNYALDDNTTGVQNCAFGWEALSDPSYNASYNTAFGYQAGANNEGGQYNVYIGYQACDTLTTGSYNVCVGQNAGSGQLTTHSEKLFIARSNTTSGNEATWIYGDDDGSCYQGDNSSSWSTTSDRRLKKNIVDNTKGLAEINQIRITNFEYRREDEIDMSEFPLADSPHQVVIGGGKEGQVQTGVIAQEIESVLPECIKVSDRGAKTVNNDPVIWALVNAVKELSAEVASLKSQINN